VATPGTSLFDIAIRSYATGHEPDRHPFAQLVLPVAGEVQLDVNGQGGRIDPLHCAFVPVGAWHTQSSRVFNRSLILDIDEAALGHAAWERLHEKPFAALNPAARKLVEFMQLLTDQQTLQPAHLDGWVPLLLDTLTLGAPQPRSRLAALLAQVGADPGRPWTTESMAQCAHLSVSRLHALFREEQGTTPHAWLLQQRIDLACRWLAGSDRAIAEVALAAGFSEQSALTRAMRQALDITPAAYRRRAARGETASILQ
jgi:AraC-like DNA-binding protein